MPADSFSSPYVVESLTASEAMSAVPVLSELLIEAVNEGAALTFNAPLSSEKAVAFWQTVIADLAQGERILLVARTRETQEIVGTVQVVRTRYENQRHRGEIAKLLVYQSARRRGIAAQLMRAAETAASAAGLIILMLDTQAGSNSERLYERLGWIKVGLIPNYAYDLHGLTGAVLFYKPLETA